MDEVFCHLSPWLYVLLSVPYCEPISEDYCVICNDTSFANVFTTFLNPSSEQRSTRNVQYQSIWVEIGLYCNWWARIHTRLSILFGMKIRKKTHFTTLIEAGAHQQPEKVKIHQFHPEETWAPLITAESLRFDQY